MKSDMAINDYIYFTFHLKEENLELPSNVIPEFKNN